MSLVDYVSKAASRTRASFTSDRPRMLDYLKQHELKSYFAADVPEEDKQRMESALERKLDEHLARYDRELDGIGRKVSSKGSMALAVANDVFAYASNSPLANVTGLGYALFAIKSIAELPALYSYVKKSHDWYGALTHLALKPVRYVLPVVGPALESGSFERMVRKNVMNETKLDFIKDYGNYVPLEEKMHKTLKLPLNDSLYRPQKQAA
ncbi:hypothetical protein KW805_01550 [Candidatus Pacearchaeota archaeon]|nr:hypothetical protein [Candidatus Pacearchaeota archaeon]